jgi:hypothetical protein
MSELVKKSAAKAKDPIIYYSTKIVIQEEERKLTPSALLFL